jgi:hypothetical protein
MNQDELNQLLQVANGTILASSNGTISTSSLESAIRENSSSSNNDHMVLKQMLSSSSNAEPGSSKNTGGTIQSLVNTKNKILLKAPTVDAAVGLQQPQTNGQLTTAPNTQHIRAINLFPQTSSNGGQSFQTRQIYLTNNKNLATAGGNFIQGSPHQHSIIVLAPANRSLTNDQNIQFIIQQKPTGSGPATTTTTTTTTTMNPNLQQKIFLPTVGSVNLLKNLSQANNQGQTRLTKLPTNLIAATNNQINESGLTSKPHVKLACHQPILQLKQDSSDLVQPPGPQPPTIPPVTTNQNIRDLLNSNRDFLKMHDDLVLAGNAGQEIRQIEKGK